MPTKYKPFINDNPPDLSSELDRISKALGAAKEDIREIFAMHFRIFLEDDDLEPLMDELEQVLTYFVVECIALPKRSPNQLKSTLSAIAKDPAKFLAESVRYDPEAVARVLGECARASQINHDEVMGFELGTGPGPPPAELKLAAENVSVKLDLAFKDTGQSSGGAPRNDQQKRLAVRLAVLFVGRGGNLRRTVHVGESGPFHAFLEVVLPIVRPRANRAGFALTVRTMVAHAQKELKASGLWSPRPK